MNESEGDHRKEHRIQYKLLCQHFGCRKPWQMVNVFFFEFVFNYFVILKMLFGLKTTPTTTTPMATTNNSNGKCLLHMHKFDKAGGLSDFCRLCTSPDTNEGSHETHRYVWEPVWWSHLTWFQAKINLFLPSQQCLRFFVRRSSFRRTKRNSRFGVRWFRNITNNYWQWLSENDAIIFTSIVQWIQWC